MRIQIFPAIQPSILITALLAVAACSGAPSPTDPEYLAEVEQWRGERLARLTADDGWLTLTGLFWLEPGENTFGSGEANAIVLPDKTIASVAGRLMLDAEGMVTAVAEEGAVVSVNGEPLTESVLQTDADAEPDILVAGRIQFHVIDREGRLGVRVKDPEAATRRDFAGIQSYGIDESFRVEARLEAYDSPRQVTVPTEIGTEASYLAPGVLHFVIDGREQTLEPFLSGAENDRYFLLFRDRTSGVTTYGAGRFLYAPAVDENGVTTLDFNLAYNPPCAFTPYATCPLAPPQNWLETSIEAGEKHMGIAH